MRESPVAGTDKYRNLMIAFAVGVLVGVLIGWSFYGFVSLLMRISVPLIVISLVAMGWHFWRKNQVSRESAEDSVAEANWRDIGTR